MRKTIGSLLLVACAVPFLSCGSGNQPLSVVDPDAAPLTPTYEQVESIIRPNCAGCHSGGELDYASCAGISNGDGTRGIRDTVLNGGSMPPGAWPRIDERDKLILKRWIEQGACSPCNPCP